jgi:hypothetical protein
MKHQKALLPLRPFFDPNQAQCNVAFITSDTNFASCCFTVVMIWCISLAILKTSRKNSNLFTT